MLPHNSDPNIADNNISPEVHQELSKVAATPRQNILILVGICIVFGYLFFFFFIGNKTVTKDTPLKAPTEVTKPAQTVVSEVPEIPQLPEPPKLVEPTVQLADAPDAPIKLDLPPPTPDNSTRQNVPTPPLSIEATLPSNLNENDDIRKRKEAKRKSSIVLLGDTKSKKTTEQTEEETDFKRRGNMEMILGRGKVIDAVLESAIDSDFGGEVRALVSRDMFSESGKIVLIPKGSRIFGTYSSGDGSNYGRIMVDWNRIDLASGYTVNIQSATIDNLGRKGIQGRVDNKFKERLSNSLLSSAFNIAFANALDKIVAPTITSQLATQNEATAGQLNNLALAIYNDSTKDTATKIQLICSTIQSAIPDKTSTAYITFAASCLTIITSPTSDPTQNLTSLMASVNSAATTLLASASTQITPTQAQNASKQAFTDV
ncbi:MAG: TrbI/VirB10 family protein, partial [Janthinobacterium lividum]